MDRQFVDLALTHCEHALVKRGFRRLRKHKVALDITADWLGWLGLNTGNYSSHLLINPFVGIHCIPMMRLIAELGGERYKLGHLATFAVHLGCLCPDEDAIIFTPDSDVREVAERLAFVVQKYGVPYMRELANFETTLKALLTRVESFGGYPQRVAVVLYLMGKPEEARVFVNERQAEYLIESRDVRDIFDRFAAPFIKLLTH
jgi:hypothetical protein